MVEGFYRSYKPIVRFKSICVTSRYVEGRDERFGVLPKMSKGIGQNQISNKQHNDMKPAGPGTDCPKYTNPCSVQVCPSFKVVVYNQRKEKD